MRRDSNLMSRKNDACRDALHLLYGNDVRDARQQFVAVYNYGVALSIAWCYVLYIVAVRLCPVEYSALYSA